MYLRRHLHGPYHCSHRHSRAAAATDLRLSGDTAIETAQAVFTPQFGSALGQQPSRRLVLGTLRDRQGRVIDQAMAGRLPGRPTATPARTPRNCTATAHPAVLARPAWRRSTPPVPSRPSRANSPAVPF